MEGVERGQFKRKSGIGRASLFHIFGNFGAQSKHKTSQKKSNIAGTSNISRYLHSQCRYLEYIEVPANSILFLDFGLV